MATARKKIVAKHPKPVITSQPPSLLEDATDNAPSSPQPITLYDLMVYREYMTQSQMERYGDYYLFREPKKPFTTEEFDRLKQKREYCLMCKRVKDARDNYYSAKLEAEQSLKETWQLLIRSQLQRWGKS